MDDSIVHLFFNIHGYWVRHLSFLRLIRVLGAQQSFSFLIQTGVVAAANWATDGTTDGATNWAAIRAVIWVTINIIRSCPTSFLFLHHHFVFLERLQVYIDNWFTLLVCFITYLRGIVTITILDDGF